MKEKAEGRKRERKAVVGLAQSINKQTAQKQDSFGHRVVWRHHL